uniref:Uncharacterized protein n=1 Tax=Tanacetum cinerariifolium TaxID=118510 RepID=A0A6L2JCG5_TANCI|nr:hypothetical protein [Tanacetum cinerariifolium]
MMVVVIASAYVIEEQKQTWFLATVGDDQIILVTAANRGLPADVYKCLRLLHRFIADEIMEMIDYYLFDIVVEFQRRSLLIECLTIYMHHMRGSVYKLHIFRRSLLDDYKKGKKATRDMI